MQIVELTPAADEACTEQTGAYYAPPPQFLDTVGFAEWRIVPWLRAAAAEAAPQARVPWTAGTPLAQFNAMELLKRSAVSFYLAAAGQAGAQNTQPAATALADLAVTGSAAFASFRQSQPKESDLLPFVSSRLNTWAMAQPGVVVDSNQVLSCVRQALDRAYKVAWALRDPDPVRREQTRASLGWVAVSGEDDAPHRPVNVPSAVFPQFTLSVTVPCFQPPTATASTSIRIVTVQTRYSVASSSMPALPAGYPSPMQQTAIAGGPDNHRSFPDDVAPVIPATDEVILFIHGQDSRLEEFGDVVRTLHALGRCYGKSYTVIGFDLPGDGYSMVDENNTIFDHTKIAATAATTWDILPGGSLATFPLLDYLLEFVVKFVDALDAVVPVKNRMAAVIGGSLGGNLSLRLGEHGALPWLKHIVAWSPASVWTTFNHHTEKGPGLTYAHDRMDGLEDNNPPNPSRLQFFYDSFVAAVSPGLPAQPQTWFRDNPLWGVNCKAEHISAAREDRREIYNQCFRRRHWRVGLEQLLFSHWDGPNGPPRFASITVPTFLAAGDQDDFLWAGIFSASKSMAQLMVTTPGKGVFFHDTGHSIDAERPQLFTEQMLDFLNPQVTVRMVTAVSPAPDELMVVGMPNAGAGTSPIQYANWAQAAPGWNGWHNLGPSVASPGSFYSSTVVDGGAFTFQIGPNGRVAFASPVQMGAVGDSPNPGRNGVPGGAVHGVSCQPGMLHVFYTDPQGLILMSRGDNTPGGITWPENTGISGCMTAPGGHITAVSRHPGQVDAFTAGTDGQIHTAGWNAAGGWKIWSPIAGLKTRPGAHVAAVCRSLDHLDIFVADEHGQTMSAACEPGMPWQPWHHIQGGMTCPGGYVTAISRSADMLDIFTVGTDGRVYTAAWNPAARWQGWWPIGNAQAQGLISPVSRSPDKIDIFFVAPDGVVQTAAWQPGFAQWAGPSPIDVMWLATLVLPSGLTPGTVVVKPPHGGHGGLPI